MVKPALRNRSWLAAGFLALLLVPGDAPAQELERALIGGGLGVLGGVAVTVGTVVARAHFQNEYLHEPSDLIHWQSAAMIGGPAAGVAFGLDSRDALVGSVVGSVSGLILGAGGGALVGWLVTDKPEGPWAGATIGGGFGLAVGGLLGGVLGWRGSSEAEQPLQVGVTIRVGGR